MKILDIPQSGKLGMIVSMPGRYGQVRRILAIPSNPASSEQLEVRASLTARSVHWRQITQSQRNAWIALAADHQTRSRLGQSGPMTGEQLFIRINCNNARVGEPLVEDPPAYPEFDDNVVTGFSIANPGTPALTLACSGTSDAINRVWACPPLSQGRQVATGWNELGELPAINNGNSNITSLYTAKFGSPPVGSKVFVRTHQILDGWADQFQSYSAIVPASS